MKIRNMVILFTVIIVGAYLAAITTINTSQINQVDITEINQVTKTIEQNWNAGDTKKTRYEGGTGLPDRPGDGRNLSGCLI